MNVSHSYPEGVWTASAQRRPSVSGPWLLLCRRLIATRIELRAEAAGLAWRWHLKRYKIGDYTDLPPVVPWNFKTQGLSGRYCNVRSLTACVKGLGETISDPSEDWSRWYPGQVSSGRRAVCTHRTDPPTFGQGVRLELPLFYQN